MGRTNQLHLVYHLLMNLATSWISLCKSWERRSTCPLVSSAYWYCQTRHKLVQPALEWVYFHRFRDVSVLQTPQISVYWHLFWHYAQFLHGVPQQLAQHKRYLWVNWDPRCHLRFSVGDYQCRCRRKELSTGFWWRNFQHLPSNATLAQS